MAAAPLEPEDSMLNALYYLLVIKLNSRSKAGRLILDHDKRIRQNGQINSVQPTANFQSANLRSANLRSVSRSGSDALFRTEHRPKSNLGWRALVGRDVDCFSGPLGSYHLIPSRTKLNVTTSGLACQRWDKSYPNTPTTAPPSADNNFCSDHDSDPGGAWCYTTNATVRWQYCDVLYRCENLSDYLIWTD